MYKQIVTCSDGNHLSYEAATQDSKASAQGVAQGATNDYSKDVLKPWEEAASHSEKT